MNLLRIWIHSCLRINLFICLQLLGHNGPFVRLYLKVRPAFRDRNLLQHSFNRLYRSTVSYGMIIKSRRYFERHNAILCRNVSVASAYIWTSQDIVNGRNKKFLLLNERYATSFLYSSSRCNTLSAYCGYLCYNKVSFVICIEVIQWYAIHVFCKHNDIA